MLPDTVDAEQLEREVTLYSETVDAPVTMGQELGTLTLRDGDTVFATVPLLALNDVSASRFLVLKRQAEEFVSGASFRYVVFALIVLLLLVLLLSLLFGRRRRRYSSGGSYRRRNYRGRRRY